MAAPRIWTRQFTDMQQLPLLLNTGEAAILFRMNKDAVSRMCSRGEIPGAQRVGKEWRIPKAAIERMFGGVI